jgi:membrane protease YdiL (CAAX protease family)
MIPLPKTFAHADEAPAPAPAPRKKTFTVQSVFFDADGLRAVWGILLFLFFREAIGDVLWAFLYPRLPQAEAAAIGAPASSTIAPAQIFIGEAVVLAALAAATILMSRIERRPLRGYGFAGLRWLGNLLSGTASGLVLLSALVLTLWRSGFLIFDGRQLFGRAALHFGTMWIAGFLLVALFEESFFRGYLQFTLARGLSRIYRWLRTPHHDAFGFWTSALLLSFGFGVIHRSNAGESPVGVLSAGLIGIVFCFSLWRTGSLWWAIGFHLAWDWAQSFLFGVADSGMMLQRHLLSTHPAGRPIFSGGFTGPEGSLFILPILGLAVAAVLLTRPANALPAQPYSEVPQLP